MQAIKIKIVFLLLLFNASFVSGQESRLVMAGPALGYIEYRTAVIWLQVNPSVKKVAIKYWHEANASQARTVVYNQKLQQPFNAIKLQLTNLQYNTTYTYQCLIDGKTSVDLAGKFTTQDIWQWRKPAPDLTFIAGSCAYVNDPLYDRPGKPYGNDSSIFIQMAKEKASFMLWLGDNWYTREADYYSEWGLHNRPAHDRALPVLQPLYKAMSHHAIWDDHDYGPNNADKSFVLKETSRNVFMSNWSNPSFGEQGQGVYTKINRSDVDVMMLDDRWFRSSDNMPDSLDGKPNPNKKMFGDVQMEWFKTAMRQSQDDPNIHWRIVATGSQVLNPFSPRDCFRHYPAEYNEMMQFLMVEKITGVLFITGDRHLSEINKIERPGGYPLYDVTASPLTAGFSGYAPEEVNNTSRIRSIEKKQNYARLTFSGAGLQRKLVVDFIGINGEVLSSWSTSLADLQFKK